MSNGTDEMGQWLWRKPDGDGKVVVREQDGMGHWLSRDPGWDWISKEPVFAMETRWDGTVVVRGT